MLRQTLFHELVHLELGRGLSKAKAPLWFREGLAQLLERGIDATRPPLSQQMRGWGQAIPIDSLTEHFPHWGAKAERAYAQSEAMVRFLYDEMNREGFLAFVGAMQLGSVPFETLLRQRYGYSSAQFEERFLAKAQFNRWWHELFRDSTLLGMAGILLAFAAVRSRRRQRVRLNEMRRDEFMELE